MNKGKKIITSLLLFIGTCGTASAQSISGGGMPPMQLTEKEVYDTAYLKVYYEYSFLEDSTVRDHRTEGQTLLLVGKNYVGFGDFYQWKTDSLNDALTIGKRSPMEFFTQGMAMLNKKTYDYPLVRNVKSGNATIQIRNINTYQYTQDVEPMKWTMEEGDTAICDIPCKKASCTFGGREWTAWYAPDYALPFGPYLFSGLPGLIFSIKDTKNNHSFSLNGIETVNRPEQVYLTKNNKIIKTSRQNARKGVENEKKDVLKALLASDTGIINTDDLRNEPKKVDPYNPIELK